MSQAVREISELKMSQGEGGGFRYIFFYFHPDSWGFMIQFDLGIFFKRIGSTTN